MPFQAALREMIRIGWAHILSFQSQHNNAECDSTLMSGFKILPIDRTHKISKKTLIMMWDCDRIAKFASAPPGDLLIMHGICKSWRRGRWPRTTHVKRYHIIHTNRLWFEIINLFNDPIFRIYCDHDEHRYVISL